MPPAHSFGTQLRCRVFCIAVLLSGAYEASKQNVTQQHHGRFPALYSANAILKKNVYKEDPPSFRALNKSRGPYMQTQYDAIVG